MSEGLEHEANTRTSHGITCSGLAGRDMSTSLGLRLCAQLGLWNTDENLELNEFFAGFSNCHTYYFCRSINIHNDADVKTFRIRESYPVFNSKVQRPDLLTRIVSPSQRISLPQPTNPQHNKAPFLLSCCPIMGYVSVSVSDGLDRYQSHFVLALTITVSREVYERLISKARG